MSKTTRQNDVQPGNRQASLEVPGCDTQRRMLLGGLAGAVATALFATACKSSEEEDAAAKAVATAKPEPAAAPAAAPPDPLTPPGAEPLSAEESAWAEQFLARNFSVDVHCHPGMFFFLGLSPEDPMLQKMASVGVFEKRTVADMAAGQLSAACFATVADISLIGAGKQGLFARREFEPGEAYSDHQRQMAVLQGMVDSGLVAPVRSLEDLVAAKNASQVGAIFASEGGDFLEEKGERLEEAWKAGIRKIGLVHYHINQIGDIQTAEPKHAGLTEFGREAVVEMNRLGMIIDMAHATFETTRDAAELSSQPVIVSHSFIADAGIQHPRLLSEDHARVIAQTGGLVGAWPSGIGNPDFPSFIDRLVRLVDFIGIDHVGLGTDMDANYLPVFTNYRQMPHLPVALRSRGMNDEDIAKILGGNFMRVFNEVTQVARVSYEVDAIALRVRD